MMIPLLPENETQRLEATKSYNILDTLPEQDYDSITELAAYICDIPIALITALDDKRNFFKSHHGIPFNESPRDISFCGHAILGNEILIIEDAREDERFKDNPLVTDQNAIFYAGVPLVNPEGFKLGTICVFDHKPKKLSARQLNALKTLGKQVVHLLELRRSNYKLSQAKIDLELRYIQLKAFANHVSHDLKSPLSNIMSLADLLESENDFSPENKTYIKHIQDSATILKDYIDSMLKHYKSEELINSAKEIVRLSDIFEDIKKLLISKGDILTYPDVEIKNINKAAVSQILINLVDNALKYNVMSPRFVKIKYESLDKFHKFYVIDNGIGIPKDKQEHIFEIFSTVSGEFSTTSTGIGLSTVKTLVEKLNGKISVSSEENKGSSFIFTIGK